jgi:hypothetical protein
MKPFLPLVAVLAALPATSAHAAVYKITSATHTSSSSKAEQGYQGKVTTTWKLAKPTREAANKIQVTYGPGYVIQGLGRVNVAGATNVDITTDWKNGRCAWSAPTGDETYPMAAPDVFDLVVSVDPRNPKRVVAGHTGLAASLSNGYLGTECSTGIGGEPDRDDTQIKSIPLNTFKKKKVTLTFAGSTNEEGIAYAWSTKFVLKRVKR